MEMHSAVQNLGKRKRGQRLFEFHTFGDPGYPADYNGPFRDNVHVFLEECGDRLPYNVDANPAWVVNLQEEAKGALIFLYVVEEAVVNSPNRHCDRCRCIGWSHHMVSNRRYHFIVAAPETREKPLLMASIVGAKVCPNCHDRVSSNHYSCYTCGEKVVEGRVLDLQTHLLHGMIHCNGFGHLLCVNGREKGSKYVSGRELVDLWDRLCIMLRARKISVEDIAKKRSMEFRLLNCIACGESWYGRWGYKFGHGSYGITQQMYTKAIEAVRGIPLTVMLEHFKDVDRDVLAIVRVYQRISGQALCTIGDLIRFMMELKNRLPLNPPTSTTTTTNSPTPNSTNGKTYGFPRPLGDSKKKEQLSLAVIPKPINMSTPCRWSMKRLELAKQVIVDALKNCEKRTMSRQDVRDAARAYIGDTGLLDFVLKTMSNCIVEGYVVRRAVNPRTKILEYNLEEVSATKPAETYRRGCHQTKPTEPDDRQTRRTDVLKDIMYLYKNVLENYKPAKIETETVNNSNCTVLTAIPTATRIILDTKHFIKDYKGEMTRRGAYNEWAFDDDEMLRIMCSVAFFDTNVTTRPPPPPEMVVLPPHASIGDLKEEAQKALRDTYIVLHGFEVEAIVDLDGNDDELLFGTVESGSTVRFQGSGIDMSSDLRYEGGDDNWTVDCPCGAKDDDGEQMIACDLCEVWQHTRCGRISDTDPIPRLFLCNRCGLGLFQAIV